MTSASEDVASASVQALAAAFVLQLETDQTCPKFVKNVFKDSDNVLYRLHNAQVCFLASPLSVVFPHS